MCRCSVLIVVLFLGVHNGARARDQRPERWWVAVRTAERGPGLAG